MALTETQRARIRKLLGWSPRFHQVHSDLDQALDALATFPEDEASVIAMLAQLDVVDAAITSALEIAGVTRTGPIELLDDSGAGIQRSEGRRIVASIAATLRVEIKRNFYGGGGMTGGPIGYG